MTKILIINLCYECPYCSSTSKCTIMGEKIELRIADWCPLDDYDEMKPIKDFVGYK